MDQPSALVIDGLSDVASLTYDPRTRTYIAGSRGITFASPGNPSRHVTFESHINQDSVSSPTREFCPPENLCFVPNHKSKNLIISPSGLMVVSKQSSKISEKPILYTNYGFSSGIHYWEIICPLSCAGLSLGVVKMENKKLTLEAMNAFRTTTTRVVGILLDLENLKLQFWLNGKEQVGRSKTLSGGYWLPAIRMSGIDNCIILNPFTQQLPSANPYDCYNVVKHDFDEWVFIEEDKQKLPEEAQVVDEIVVADDGEMGQSRLVRVKDLEEFFVVCNKANIKVLSGVNLVKLLAEKGSSKGALRLIKCIQQKEKSVQERFFKLAESKEEYKVPANIRHLYEEEIKGCEYLPCTDNLLLLGNTSLKVISREDEDKAGFVSKSGSVAGFKLYSPPSSIHEVLDLYITRLEALQLVKKIHWLDLLKNDPVSEAIPSFFEALNRALSSDREELFVSVSYLTAKKTVDSLIQSLLFSSAQFESDPTTKNLVKRYISSPLVRLLSKGRTERPKLLTLEEINLLLSIVLKLDEQLWCLTSADTVHEDIRKLWDIKPSRLHTAYGRLASFITWPIPGAIALAEAGLYNVGDRRPVLEHFRHPKIILENVLAFDQANKKEVWSFLERSFPDDRMLKGEPCVNVPLSISLRHFPAVRHMSLEDKPQEILYMESNGEYVMTGSADGSVNIWNTKLRLVRMLVTDFKRLIEHRIEAKGKSDRRRQSQDDTIFSSLFDENSESDSSSDIELPSEEKPKVEEKKVPVQPNTKLLQQLLSLGFSESMSKKALIAVNNESLDNAMDMILELQKKELPPKPEQKTQENYMILSWGCHKCTLINSEGKGFCEVCNEPAPQSAYKLKTKEEKKVEMKVEQKENKEEEKLKRAKEIEEEIKLLKQAEVQGYAMIMHREYPVTPFTLACALSSKNERILKIRRFRYSEKYIQSFILPVTNGRSKGFVSQVTGTWIDTQDYSNAKQQLFQEHKDALEIYSPLFVRNQLQGNWRFDKTKLAGTHLILKEELKIPLDFEKVISVIGVTSEGNHSFIVLGKKGSLQLTKVSINSSYGDSTKIEAKIESSVSLPSDKDEAKLLYNGNDLMVVVTKENTLIVNVKDLSIQRTISHSNSLTNVFLISEDDSLYKNTLIFAEKNSLNRYYLIPKEHKETEEVKKTEALKPVRTDFPEIKAESLTIEDLASYELQMKSKRVGCKAIPADGTLLLSSKKDKDSGYCSKHNWSVCETKGSLQEFVLEFQKRTTLNHLHVSLTFTQDKAAEMKSDETTKLEDTKLPQAKETSVKDLGLLSVHGSGDLIVEGKKYHIPLVIATHKGAQYSFQNTVSRMLADNNTTFASNYPRPHFILKHQFGKRLLVDKVNFCTSG